MDVCEGKRGHELRLRKIGPLIGTRTWGGLVGTLGIPATIDGGDVLRVGHDLYVGLSTRTNEAAVEQLRRLLPATYRVHGVPIHDALQKSQFAGKSLAQIGAAASVCSPVTKKPATGAQEHIPEGSAVSYADAPPAFGK